MILIVKLACRQLRQSRRRTLLTLSGMVLSVAILILAFSLHANITAALRSTTREIGHVSILVEVGPVSELIYILFAIVVCVIFFSVILLTGAFYAGGSERMEQLDVLRNAGVSMSQIRFAVAAEALILAVPGLLIGTVLGKLFALVGIRLSEGFLQSVAYVTGIGHIDMLGFYWEVIPISLAISMAIIVLSSALAARPIARLVENRGLYSSELSKSPRRRSLLLEHFVQRIFKFKGLLACRFLERNMLEFRLIVGLLTASIILIIAGATIQLQADALTTLALEDINRVESSVLVGLYIPRNNEGSATVPPHASEEVASVLRSYPGASVLGFALISSRYYIDLERSAFTQAGLNRNPDFFAEGDREWVPVNLIAMDEETYAHFATMADAPLGSGILIGRCISGREIPLEIPPCGSLSFAPDTGPLRLVRRDDRGNVQERELSVLGEVTECKLPFEPELGIALMNTFALGNPDRGLTILAPVMEARVVTYLIAIEDEKDFIDFATAAIEDNEALAEAGIVTTVANLNFAHDALLGAERGVVLIVYSLSGLLALLGTATIINTSFSGRRIYARDIAIISTAGLSTKDLRHILGLTSLFHAILAVILGIPLGIAVSWSIYNLAPSYLATVYVFPWRAIAQSAFIIFLVVGVSVHFLLKDMGEDGLVEILHRLR